MPDNPTKDALYELLDYLEQVETRTGALLQFLKDNDLVTDDKLAPYLEQAANATEVKSRAMHARFDFLFKSDESAKPATDAVPAPDQKSPQGAPEQSQGKSRDVKQNEVKKDNKQPKSSPEEQQEPSEIVAAHKAKEASSGKHEESRPESKTPDKRTLPNSQ